MTESSKAIPIVDYSRSVIRETFINYEGNFLFPEKYFRRVYTFVDEDGVAIIINDDFDYQIIDMTGNFTSDKTWWYLQRNFSNGLTYGTTLSFKNENREEGFYSTTGELVFPIKVLPDDEIFNVATFGNGLLPALKENDTLYVLTDYQYKNSSNWCLLDTKGNIVVENITATQILSFTDGVARVYDGKKWGLMNTSGKMITGFEFEKILEPVHGYMRTKLNGKDILLRKDGKVFYCSEFK